MTSITKLFKTLRDAASKSVKRHITNEITAMYCSTPALVETLLEEILFLSESSIWEDRLAGSKILEELFKKGTVLDTFSGEEYELDVNVDRILELPKFLATRYEKNETVKAGKDFIDLEDHNVVLSLSDINIPGAKTLEGSLLRRRKQMQKAQKTEEKREVQSKDEFYQCVLTNIESYVWERRHGAALLLLGIFRGISLRDPAVSAIAVLSSKEYLVPMLNVLILDRFNDYEMDTAVSPVRETIAKALKALTRFLPPKVIKDLLSLLTKLGKYEDWQIKYSGLVGLQYIQDVISPEAHKNIVHEIGVTCLTLLNDLDEDVKRVAAGILTGILERYAQVYAEDTEEDIRSRIAEVLDVEDVIEKCWEALQEEEDLAISKAKIMGVLEKIAHGLKYELGEIDKEKWRSVLYLTRNPIDTVRLAVLSLLDILPALDPDSLIASLLFSVMAEQEKEIHDATASLLTKKLLSADVKVQSLQSIINAFLSVLCSSYTIGANFSQLKLTLVTGEGDVCTTDDGCKSMGEDAVLAGRVEMLMALLNSTEQIHEYIVEFFLHRKALPYFIFFKAVTAAIRPQESGVNGERRLIDSLLQTTEEADKNDINRAAYSLIRHIEGKPTKEDADVLAYLYNIPTPNTLLRILAVAIQSAPEKFTEFFDLAVECVCAREESKIMDMVIKEIGENKKVKLSEDFEQNEPEWEMLTLFKVLNNDFLETEVFLKLKENLGRCAVFLQNTIECFDSVERLQFIFTYAIDNNLDRIVSYLIRKDRKNNEEFIMAIKGKLEKIVTDTDGEHTELLSFIENTIGSSELSLLVVIVFPLVNAMNTPFKVQGLRERASKAFAIASPSMWMRTEWATESEELKEEIKKAHERIDSLMKPEDLSKIKMDIELREYQKKGIEWIGFLRKSGLSGMLCDDMGLGKTIQVLAFLALQSTAEEEKSVLVLCPSALTGHWHMEVSAHFPTLSSTTIDKFTGKGICVASFDKFRIHYAKFIGYKWFYLVLDEGHVIRNSNTLLHQRVKMIKAESKLLLSGTPIQNSVGELWALFDILMPGFLGKEKEFSREYIKPIEKAREGKGTVRETEIAKRKLEDLHRCVLPFILRRMKETVLSDLPPKVISDVYVELEEVQRKVYDELSAGGVAEGEYGKISASSGNFSLLMRLIKTCSHVSLLAGNEVPIALTQKEKNAAPSGKVLALLDLLKVIVNTSKILVFCQYKATIDMLIKDVSSALPEVNWCRLDGSIKGDERSVLAKKFNADAGISIMYLTTHAGGLGLNLTGADTVIFFEHDWNPMMDLQAMDRAHRIGQKKSVNVFRLISKNTIEESIMSLQRFKNYVAGTVVNQQNVEIESMDTSNALERLTKEKLPQEKSTKEEEYHDFI